MCRVVLYIAFMATLQVLVDAKTCWIFVLQLLCVFSLSPACGFVDSSSVVWTSSSPLVFLFRGSIINTHFSSISDVIFLCWWMQHANLR